MDKILKVKNVSKTYQAINGETEAIKDISFDVEQGEFVSIIGPSGCGKSTILSIIAGLEEKTKGSIQIDGKEYYKTRIKSTDAFSLIYDNSKNDDIQKYTNIFIITNEREIEEIYFSVKDKNSNKYYVDLKLDFGLQDIKLDIN